jgi:hypothetical protein
MHRCHPAQCSDTLFGVIGLLLLGSAAVAF